MPQQSIKTLLPTTARGKCFLLGTCQFFKHETFHQKLSNPFLFRRNHPVFPRSLTSLTAHKLSGQLCTWETKTQAPRSHDSLRSPTDFYLELDICHCCNYLKFFLWEHCLQNLKCPLENIFPHPSSRVNYCHLETHYNTAHLETEQ